MHPIRRRKMMVIVISILVAGLVVGLVLYALRQNISLFYTPTEVATGVAPINHPIRLGGLVVEGSIQRSDDLRVRFQITDNHETIAVVYQGILPDLFREGKGVVVQGMWSGNQAFQASSVLAKHDENYMPPEVKDALAKHVST